MAARSRSFSLGARLSTLRAVSCAPSSPGVVVRALATSSTDLKDRLEQQTLADVRSRLRVDQGSERAAEADEPWDDDVAEGDAEAGHEVGGPKGLEPTRFGDWERKGRCTDFA